MIITREILDMGRSDLGGWSDEQFAQLGFKRPVPSGWMRRVIGFDIPDERVKKFLELRNAHMTLMKFKYGMEQKRVRAESKALREQIMRDCKYRCKKVRATPEGAALHAEARAKMDKIVAESKAACKLLQSKGAKEDRALRIAAIKAHRESVGLPPMPPRPELIRAREKVTHDRPIFCPRCGGRLRLSDIMTPRFILCQHCNHAFEYEKGLA